MNRPAPAPDFVELHEDVAPSAVEQGSRAHARSRARTWSTWNIAALWIGMSVVITTYTLAGGMIEEGMTWWQAMLTILLGNTIVLVPMCLNAHAGTKYGVSFPVLCRASFGVQGANVPAMLRAVVACGWFGIQTWLGGAAIDTCSIGGVARLGRRCPVRRRGSRSSSSGSCRSTSSSAGSKASSSSRAGRAPLLLLGGLLLLGWASSEAAGSATCWTSPAAAEGEQQLLGDLPGLPHRRRRLLGDARLNIPDFTRYARSQRSQMLGQALGLPTTMTLFAFIGVAVTSATLHHLRRADPRPRRAHARIDSAPVVLFGDGRHLRRPAHDEHGRQRRLAGNDFSNLNPRRISYVTGGLITAVIGIADDAVEADGDAGGYVFTWLIGYSG